MKTQTYPTDLTDHQWDYSKDLIPAAKMGGRPRSLDMRQVINAILYILVIGAQWRMLPKDYPTWKSVYHYSRS
jgi:transposase